MANLQQATHSSFIPMYLLSSDYVHCSVQSGHSDEKELRLLRTGLGVGQPQCFWRVTLAQGPATLVTLDIKEALLLHWSVRAAR